MQGPSAAYWGYRAAQALSLRLRPEHAFGLAERIADLKWRGSRADREAVRGNLSIMLGRAVRGREQSVREVFRHFGRYIVEFFTMHQVPRPHLTLEGYDHLHAVQRQRRGAIILTAHVGNWEAGAVILSRLGFRVAAVALPHEHPHLDRLFNAQRARCGVTVIPLDAATVRASLEQLRHGNLLGLLGDQDFMGTGLPVRLWNRQVRLPRGPAVLSLRSHAPILPTFLIREGIWKFRLSIEPPIHPDISDAPEAAIRRLTEDYAATLQRTLSRVPEQWLMFRPLAHPT